ncbi:MAG: hydantoinase/oxoprolinase N-terminal domain-containing protein [Bacillota bacterium]
MAEKNLCRLSVNTGSTYTDACLFIKNTGEIHSVKVPTNPDNPVLSITEAFNRLSAKTGVSRGDLYMIIYGTTTALNALFQGRSPKTALLVTRGFKDLLFNRQRRLTFEISERVAAGGKVLVPLVDKEIRELAPLLAEFGIESIAVCLLHSYSNPGHERRVREILNEICPDIPVTISSDIFPRPGELLRSGTTALSAAIKPLIQREIKGILSSIAPNENSPGFFCIQSDGSAITFDEAAGKCAGLILSGHAGGIMSCSLISGKTGRPNLVAFEMGGSGTCVSLINKGQPLYNAIGPVAGYPLALPVLNLDYTGVGNSTAVFIDGDGLPGFSPPGGSDSILPTCEDACLVLGRTGPRAYIYSGKHPHRAAVSNLIKENTGLPGITVADAAKLMAGSLVNSSVKAISRALSRGGYDPREFTLVAYGGAGPLYAAEIALRCGIQNVLIPPFPGVNSALGLLSVLQKNYEYSLALDLSKADPDFIYESYRLLEEKALEELSAQGIPRSDIMFTRSVDLSYSGQSLQQNIQFPAGRIKSADLSLLGRSFSINFSMEYGFTPDETAIEITKLRLKALADSSNIYTAFNFNSNAAVKDSKPGPVEFREVYFGESAVKTPVYDRFSLSTASTYEGPLIIEQDDATTLVWPRMSAAFDKYGNIMINVGVK